ncbi:related to lactam utilization protein lamB [Phialocephala subalpina]|uniref:Related to lactam utilization protein lamB n=1 Tax=Phialocephala subalpina TaxID=576137 RepID=A0A1L7WJ45_9HELO|nr:related to lactam utilization protein lamB [Phialocephala subalpina]
MTERLSKIETNCDMGEGFGKWKMGPDEELMQYIDAANIACGYHAGDPSLMLKTVRLAKKHGVKAGAHPGLPDLFGFGRRKMEIDPGDMYAMILYQVGALKAMLDAEGVPLSHIKPHGELFFYMTRDPVIRSAVLDAAAHYKVPVYGCKNEGWASMCKEKGIYFQEELYVDIDYTKEGEMVSVAKSKPAIPEVIQEKIILVAEEDNTIDVDGNKLRIGFEGNPFSVCLHSDMPTTLENVKAARKAVNEINVKKFP